MSGESHCIAGRDGSSGSDQAGTGKRIGSCGCNCADIEAVPANTNIARAISLCAKARDALSSRDPESKGQAKMYIDGAVQVLEAEPAYVRELDGWEIDVLTECLWTSINKGGRMMAVGSLMELMNKLQSMGRCTE